MIDYFDLAIATGRFPAPPGESSKAALSAFDYIMRNAPAEDIAEAA